MLTSPFRVSRRLREEGWGKELDGMLYSDTRALRKHSLVAKSQVLTDRGLCSLTLPTRPSLHSPCSDHDSLGDNPSKAYGIYGTRTC